MREQADVALGIDVGLTSVKVAAFAATGELLAAAHRATPAASSSGGRHEIDMLALWEQVASALRQVIEPAGDAWGVTSVGVTGHGNGLYLIDADGHPAGPAITSSDTRAGRFVQSLPAETALALRTQTGSAPWAGQPLVLLAWLAEHQPEVYDAATVILGCKDWVRYCLTGATGMDRTDAGASGLLDAHGRISHGADYCPATFELLGLPANCADKLPPLYDSDAMAGKLTATASAKTFVPDGTPVAAGSIDCAAGVIAAGGTSAGDATLILGTWAISAVVAPPLDELGEILMAFALPGDGDMTLFLNSAPASGAALDWLLATLGLSKDVAFGAAAHVPAGAGGLLFLPFVHGLPELPGATGTFIGLRTTHTPAHLVRAALEGIAHYVRLQLGRHDAAGATPSGSCRLIGGGARSTLWSQIFADVLGRPVQRVEGEELGARGAAMLGAAAAGGSPLRSGSAASTPSALVTPGPDADVYRSQAGDYDRWFAAAAGIWTTQETA